MKDAVTTDRATKSKAPASIDRGVSKEVESIPDTSVGDRVKGGITKLLKGTGNIVEGAAGVVKDATVSALSNAGDMGSVASVLKEGVKA